MDKDIHVRRGWLKAMYLYTLLGAGGTGFGMVLFPDVMRSALGFPAQDPAVFKLYGSVLLARDWRRSRPSDARSSLFLFCFSS